jgi:hypothetical protein
MTQRIGNQYFVGKRPALEMRLECSTGTLPETALQEGLRLSQQLQVNVVVTHPCDVVFYCTPDDSYADLFRRFANWWRQEYGRPYCDSYLSQDLRGGVT